MTIARNPLPRSGRAVLPHPGWDRTQAQCQSAAGSSCGRLLIGIRRCLIPRLGPFPVPPRVIPDGGISPVRLGTMTFPEKPSHESPALKRVARTHARGSGLFLSSSYAGLTEVPGSVSRLLSLVRPS